jgi:TRAP-type C4-dicarboxylate transport system substrate-binding protein
LKRIPLVIIVIFLLFGPHAAYSQKKPGRQITVKLASMVPANTPWGTALNRMASEWAAATNGEVKLQIYPNGTQGTEADVLQKLNMNVVQAAVFTSFGLNKIAPEIMALSCPFLIRSNEELEMVFGNMKPELEAKINSQEYYSMALVRGGWVKIFSKSPIFVPADLKRQKVGSDPQEPAMTQVFKSMGYQVIPVEANRTIIALNGGTIDSIYVSPIAAAGFQYFGVAKNMTSLNIAPFLGGIVMNKHTWEMIPEQHRAEIQRITRRIGMEIEISMAQLEQDAITTMIRHGLILHELNPQQYQEWYNDLERAVPSLVGTVFDRNTYNKIDALVKDYRKAGNQ